MSYRLLPQQISAQVFLVAISKNRHHDCVFFQFVLHFQRGDEVRARRDTNRKPEIRGEFLRHQDRIAIVNGNDMVQLIQMHYSRDEFVRDTLDAMLAHFMTCRERR